MSEDIGICEICGEFECEIEHEEFSSSDFDNDDSWFFDGSGMVEDD